ncbi:hypothetical protein FACS189449_01940 [Alphaproteobacteria bacterium]|nr:hypothetical protein FACS189449_01940 [Alphaproteobacteria bacterium]
MNHIMKLSLLYLPENSQGTYRKANGEIYAGDWKYDILGTTIKYQGGDTYHGGVDSDHKPHGPGIYTYADGKFYTGTWTHGLHESALYAVCEDSKKKKKRR